MAPERAGLNDEAGRRQLAARDAGPSWVTGPATRATHAVAGLLLGAAMVALVQLLVPLGAWQPVAALATGALLVALAQLAARRRGEGAGDAPLAAATALAASVPFFVASPPLLGALAALLAVGVTLVCAGRTPLALAAAAAAFLALRHATSVDLLDVTSAGNEGAFLGFVLAYGALLLAARHERWGALTLGAWPAAAALALFPALDALGVTDAGVAALAHAALLGALALAGVLLRARTLVAGACGLLACAVVAFAFLAAIPALAALVLLLSAAALVWRAERQRAVHTAARASTDDGDASPDPARLA